MPIFHSLLVFLLLGVFFKRNVQTLFLLISFILMFVLSGYRATTVGTDTLNYEQIFLFLEAGSDFLRQEIGWLFLNNLVLTYGGDFQHVLIITSLLVLVPLFYVAKKYSVNPMLTVFLFFSLYFYLQSFNIMRQSVAISFVLFSIIALANNRKPLFILLIAIGSTFHLTALLALPFIFINRLPTFSNIAYIVLVILCMIFGLFIFDIALYRLAALFGYSHYLSYYSAGNILGNALYLLVLNSFFCFILFTIKDKNNLLFKLFFLFIVVANLTARVPFGYRLIMMFSISQVLFLPYYVNSSKLDKNIVLVMVVFYALVSYLRVAGDGGIDPYINILF